MKNYCMINSKWTQSQVNFLFGRIMFLTAHLNSSCNSRECISKIIMWIMSLGKFCTLTIAPDLLYCWSSDHWTSNGLKPSQMEIILLTTKATLNSSYIPNFKEVTDPVTHGTNKKSCSWMLYHLASGRTIHESTLEEWAISPRICAGSRLPFIQSPSLMVLWRRTWVSKSFHCVPMGKQDKPISYFNAFLKIYQRGKEHLENLKYFFQGHCHFCSIAFSDT